MIGKGRGLLVESRLTDMARTVGTSKGVGQMMLAKVVMMMEMMMTTMMIMGAMMTILTMIGLKNTLFIWADKNTKVRNLKFF